MLWSRGTISRLRSRNGRLPIRAVWAWTSPLLSFIGHSSWNTSLVLAWLGRYGSSSRLGLVSSCLSWRLGGRWIFLHGLGQSFQKFCTQPRTMLKVFYLKERDGQQHTSLFLGFYGIYIFHRVFFLPFWFPDISIQRWLGQFGLLLGVYAGTSPTNRFDTGSTKVLR